MSSPIAIPSQTRPTTLSSLGEKNSSFESSSSFSSTARPALSVLPTRPSFIKLSTENSIPTVHNREEEQEPPLILTTLPSIRNNSSLLRPERSMTSTPELSHSTTTSRSSTPLLSPEPMINAPEVPCFGLGGSVDMSKKKNELYYALPQEDQYLLYLRDDAGITSWDSVAEAMRQKGYAVQVKGLRTRYCTLKRDIDISLRDAINNLNTTQDEVDNLLGSQNCRVKRLASCGKKRVGGNLRVFEEVAEVDEVDASVWSEIAAKLRASGLR